MRARVLFYGNVTENGIVTLTGVVTPEPVGGSVRTTVPVADLSRATVMDSPSVPVPVVAVGLGLMAN